MDRSKEYMRGSNSYEDVSQNSEQQYGAGQMYSSQFFDSPRKQQMLSRHGHQYSPHTHAHPLTGGTQPITRDHRTYPQNWEGHMAGQSFNPQYRSHGQNRPYERHLGGDANNWAMQKESGIQEPNENQFRRVIQNAVPNENHGLKVDTKTIVDSTSSSQECHTRYSDDHHNFTQETPKDQMTDTDLPDDEASHAYSGKRNNPTAVFAVAVTEENIMGEHESYHEGITGAEAERRLKLAGKNIAYLTRYSKKEKSYVLTVFKKQIPEDVTMHFKIVIQNGKHKIHRKQMKFDDIGTLLEYYEEHRLDPDMKKIGDKYTLEEFYEQQEKEGERVQREQEQREGERRDGEQQEQEQRGEERRDGEHQEQQEEQQQGDGEQQEQEQRGGEREQQEQQEEEQQEPQEQEERREKKHCIIL